MLMNATSLKQAGKVKMKSKVEGLFIVSNCVYIYQFYLYE